MISPVVVFTNGHAFTVRHREPLIHALRQIGSTVIGIAPTGSPATDAFHALGIDGKTLQLKRAGGNLFGEIRALLSLVALYRRLKPGLVIHATIKPVIYGTLAASWLRIPVVNLITGLGYTFTATDLRSKMLRKMVGIVYRAVFSCPNQRVILQNRDDRYTLMRQAGLSVKISRIVPGSGVDLDKFPQGNDSEKESDLVVFAGRMLFDKGVRYFVEAAMQMRDRFPETRFVLVGPADAGNPAGIPTSLLRQWNDSGAVEWWGSVDDMCEVYREASLVVLPSRREGMPKVILEAAASGLPVITTNVPGCRDSIVEGDTGFLVPYGDATALAEKMALLLDDAELRASMGRKARELAEDRFAAPVIAKQILDIAMELF